MTVVQYEALERLLHADVMVPKGQGLGDGATAAIEAFAADNGWRYDRRADYIISDYEFGWAPAWTAMHAMLSPKEVHHLVSGHFMGFRLQLFEFHETPDDDDVKGNRYVRGIIRVRLPEVYPHMLLDSHKNDDDNESSVRATYGTRYKIELEGDFPNYFDLYAVQNAPIDVRVILAPNMMQALISSSHRCDVEFYGSDLVFITRDTLYNPVVMRDVIAALREQLSYLQRLRQNGSLPRGSSFTRMQRARVDGAPIIMFGRKISAPHFLGGVMMLMGSVAMVLVLLFPQSVKSSLAYIIPPILMVAGIAVWRSGR